MIGSLFYGSGGSVANLGGGVLGAPPAPATEASSSADQTEQLNDLRDQLKKKMEEIEEAKKSAEGNNGTQVFAAVADVSLYRSEVALAGQAGILNGTTFSRTLGLA